jgi:uncharacterized membrane protein YphA (DoxX/SURF4 family)
VYDTSNQNMNHPMYSFFMDAMRVVLGILFLYASLDKILSPALFADSIRSYQILTRPMFVDIVAYTLPWLEYICGLALILNRFVHISSITISCLLIIFIAAIAQAIYRGLDISCGCFTQDPGASRIGIQKLAEDIGLLAGSVSLVISNARRKKPAA